MTTTLAPPAVGAPLQVPAGYRLVWSDEFDTDGLPDPNRWLHDTVRNKEGWHNNELQYYAAPRAQNAVVKNGRLVITARLESLRDAPDWGGQRYTSARLKTHGKFAIGRGRIEARLKLPKGQGIWPAFWMLGEHIDQCLSQLADNFPGFRHEPVMNEKGWGAAVRRDDLVLSHGKRDNAFSRLEMLVSPFNQYRVLEVVARGAVRNRENFSRNHYQTLKDVRLDQFIELIERWTLDYAEQYAAAVS